MLVRVAVNLGVVLPPQALQFMESEFAGGLCLISMQQAGLKLDTRKAPLDFLVVDQGVKISTEN